MKLLEGYFSELDIIRQEDPEEYRKIVHKKPMRTDYEQFCDYVNHGRSTCAIGENGIWIGSEKALQSFLKSFKKTHPNFRPEITNQYRGGEFVFYIKPDREGA